MSTLSESAIAFAAQNWKIYPIRRESKAPAVTGFRDWARTATVETVRDWWSMNPNDNIGAVTGSCSRLLALDCDPRNGGLESYQKLEAEHGPLPRTLTTISGRGDGGFHLLFALPEAMVVPSVELLPGIELKAERAQVVVPPSIHPDTKEPYSWANSDAGIADAPRWLIELANEAAQRKPVSSRRLRGSERESGRNVTLFTFLSLLRGQGKDDDEIRVAAQQRNDDFETPLDQYEVEKTVKSVCEYEAGKCPRPADLAAGLLENDRFLCLHGLLYVYRDGRYRPDGKEYVERVVQESLGSHWTSAKSAEIVRWLAHRTRTEPESVDTDDFVNVSNGLLDLRTGELRPHTSDFLSTIQLPVAWNPGATCERADQFLDEVLPSPETRDLIEEIIGYCLLPDCRFQKAVMLIGDGANGKSVFLSVLSSLFGREHVSSESLHDLANARFAAVSLVGKIANISPDLPRHALNDAGMFKALASGDPVSVERKHYDRFRAEIRAKLLFSANELPESRDLTRGFFRRWIIVRFPARFEGRTADSRLTEKLIAPEALSYWLVLAVRGLRRLLDQGQFTTTPEGNAELANYQTACDTVRAFVDESCEFSADAVIRKQALYDAYRAWCDASGCGAKKMIAFFQRLHSEFPNVEVTRPNQGGARIQCVRGIRVRRPLPEAVVPPTGYAPHVGPQVCAPPPHSDRKNSA